MLKSINKFTAAMIIAVAVITVIGPAQAVATLN